MSARGSLRQPSIPDCRDVIASAYRYDVAADFGEIFGLKIGADKDRRIVIEEAIIFRFKDQCFLPTRRAKAESLCDRMKMSRNARPVPIANRAE